MKQAMNRAFGFAEIVGRWLVFNVGLRELIEKCEEYFGKAITKFFLAVIGICVLLFIIGIAVNSSIYPLAQWLGGVISGNPALVNSTQAFSWVVTGTWIVLVVAMIVTIIQFRSQFWVALETSEEADRVVKSVIKTRDSLRKILREHPQDAGPIVLDMLDHIEVEDRAAAKKARKNFHPLTSLRDDPSEPDA